MMKFDPQERLRADEALIDPWIVSKGANNKDKDSILKIHKPRIGMMIKNLQRLKVNSIINNYPQIDKKLQQAVLTYFVNYMNTDDEKQFFQEIFQAFDTNNNGHLENSELLHGFQIYYNGDLD